MSSTPTEKAMTNLCREVAAVLSHTPATLGSRLSARPAQGRQHQADIEDWRKHEKYENIFSLLCA